MEQTVSVAKREEILALTMQGMGENRDIIVEDIDTKVVCPLKSQEDHICYVSRISEFPDIRNHAGCWARDFICDFMPQEVRKFSAGSQDEEALGRMLNLENPRDMVHLLGVGDYDLMVNILDGLRLTEEEQITTERIAEILGIEGD